MRYSYLNFNGNTKAAVDFYVSVFDITDAQIMTYGEGPEVPPEMKDQIMHAQMTLNGTRIMFSDTMVGEPVTIGDNVTMMLVHKDPEVLTRWFTKLSEGAEIWQPLQKTFCGPLYGSLKDRFGIVWQVNCEPEGE